MEEQAKKIYHSMPKEFWGIWNCLPKGKSQFYCVEFSLELQSLLNLHFNDAKLEVSPKKVALLFEEIESKEVENQLLDQLEEDKLKLQNTEDAQDSEAVVRLAETILFQGVKEAATDVHFEPEEEGLKVRFRVDGLLKVHQTLPEWVTAALISRLKIMGSLDIAEKRLPQDGKIRLHHENEDFDIRISTLPTKNGEKVVLRILRQTENISTLEDLGLQGEDLRKIQHLFTKPQGILYVTGPTGSGKSSTLYAGLRSISNDSLNITTIEDPVEYELSGANQVQINEKAGLTFSSSLRSILRQDPDVILVGETRDKDTASISIQAAQTGHLVLSTLHTNDSIGAISRLKDLGVAPYLISSSVLGVIAQRLVRKICKHCKTEVETNSSLMSSFPGLNQKSWLGTGCENCADTGFQGRVAIFELFEFDEQVREWILEERNPDDFKKSKKWNSLKADGVRKVNQGLTSAQELVRVIGI